MKTHLIFSLIVLFLTVATEAATNFSDTIKYVQEKYANQFTEYPILIFDKDELSYRYLEKDAFGKSKDKEMERAAIIQEYVKEKTNVELTLAEAINYEPYTTVLKESAVALPVLGRDYKKRTEYVMCGVFTASPNSNQRLDTHRILQLDTPGTYQDVNYEGLQEKFTYEELKLFSLYHELGHCIDRHFMPELYKSYEPNPHDMHLGESFAEVFGLLMLEIEGYKGLALKRALYRNLYSSVMGKWFVANQSMGFGNPMFKSGGSIYYLVPSLLEARKRLMDRVNPLKVNNMEEVKLAARDIVDTAAYEGRSFSAINYWFSEGHDKTMKLYKEYYISMPSLFDQTISDLTDFLFQNELLYGMLAGFDENVEESTDVMMPLDYGELCQYKDDKETLYNLIDQERAVLGSSTASYASQKRRKSELDSIYNRLGNCL